MINASWFDLPGQQKDLGALMVVCCTQGRAGKGRWWWWWWRGMKQSDRRRRYGWLVSKSKPSGHLSAGTDDTATGGQDAIIVSLVAEWRACELSLPLSLSLCVAATETFYQLILRTTCWDWRATACHPDSSRIKGVGVRGRMTFSV